MVAIVGGLLKCRLSELPFDDGADAVDVAGDGRVVFVDGNPSAFNSGKSRLEGRYNASCYVFKQARWGCHDGTYFFVNHSIIDGIG